MWELFYFYFSKTLITTFPQLEQVHHLSPLREDGLKPKRASLFLLLLSFSCCTFKKKKNIRAESRGRRWLAAPCPRARPGSRSAGADVCVSRNPSVNVCCQRARRNNMDALNKLKQFDAYPKTLEDFRVKTWGGATGERRVSPGRAAPRGGC